LKRDAVLPIAAWKAKACCGTGDRIITPVSS
jgi:hypothetical protein